jgi:hypothetical protein
MPAHLLDRVRALAAEPAARLDDLTDATWSSVDPEQLELCRVRIAQLLGDGAGAARRTPAATGIDDAKIAALPTWWTSDLFSAAEQAGSPSPSSS